MREDIGCNILGLHFTTYCVIVLFNHYFEGLWVLTCILFELRVEVNIFEYQIEFNYELNCGPQEKL